MTKEAVIQFAGGAGETYQVSLFERVGPTLTLVTGPGPMTLTSAEVTAFQKLLPGTTPAPALKPEGLALYGKVKAALGQPLDDLLNVATASIYLDFDNNALELRQVPWEIMWWPKNIGPGVVETSVRQAHYLSRVFTADWKLNGPPPQGPLRILIAIGIGPKDTNIEADSEVDEIMRRVQPSQRTVDIEVIRPTSRADLYDRITKYLPNIVHFIGHGTNNPPELKFQGWEWTTGDIAAHVSAYMLRSWKPDLVFLNACRSATASGELASLADAFLGSGVRAAVAMQGDIKGTSAGQLAGKFYEGLASGTPISEALSKARNPLGEKEGAFPALTLRCSPAATLPMFQCLGKEYQTRIRSCQWLPRLPVFVNQVSSRRELCRFFWPFQDADQPYRFVLLRGDSGFGKTLLGAWLLDLGLRVGHRVRYIPVSAAKPADHTSILKHIWEWTLAGPGSPLTDPLPPNADLAKALGTSQDTTLYGTFRKALADETAQRPLTIVLDDFKNTMAAGSFWVLWEHLFVPISRNELPNVNVILVLGENDYAEYRVADEIKARPELKGQKEVKLKELDPDEFKARFRDYVVLRNDEFRDNLDSVNQSVANVVTKRPKPLSVGLFEELTQNLARTLVIDLDMLS